MANILCTWTEYFRQAAASEEISSPASATASSASFKAWGRSFPLLSARRRIPAQAFGLKKYRRSIGPRSRIEESEDTATSLRDRGGMRLNSDILRVQSSPLDEPSLAGCSAARSPPSTRNAESAPNH